MIALLWFGCTAEPLLEDVDTDGSEESDTDRETDVDTDLTTETDSDVDTDVAFGDPFADVVVEFTPGEAAGFGQASLPDIVLGPPVGAGDHAGSMDVVSLGREGVIVLEFVDNELVDGPGIDLLVFENPFIGWLETGVVGVSVDGQTWTEWPCTPTAEGNYAGCAGVHPVFSSPRSGIDPTDPETAGGDAFDLETIGVTEARYVRIRDSGANSYAGTSGGFDLDAVAVVSSSRRR